MTEITDGSVELLIQLMQKIDTRAEKRVNRQVGGVADDFVEYVVVFRGGHGRWGRTSDPRGSSG